MTKTELLFEFRADCTFQDNPFLPVLLLRVVCQCKILEPYVLITRCRILITVSSEKCTETTCSSGKLVVHWGIRKTDLKKIPMNPISSLLDDRVRILSRWEAVTVGVGWRLLDLYAGEMVAVG